MSLLLHIETSSPICSVCISNDNKRLAIRETKTGNHSYHIHSFIREVMNEADVEFGNLRAISLSAGPGSYTGLRIGAATAKAICMVHSLPLIAIDSLEILFNSMKQMATTHGNNSLFVPTIDARRNEIYYRLFQAGGTPLDESKNCALSENFLANFRSMPVILGGNAAGKCIPYLTAHEVTVDTEATFSSAGMVNSAMKKLRWKQFEDITFFEPAYIKPVFITERRKKQE